MKTGDLITVDVLSKEIPFFIDKEAEPDKAWITCEVKVGKNETWEGEVVTISSSGKYIVRLTKLIK